MDLGENYIGLSVTSDCLGLVAFILRVIVPRFVPFARAFVVAIGGG